MRVWKMTADDGRQAITASSSTEHGIATAWTATFVVDVDLGFEVGDQVTAIPTPWAGAMMGGRVTGYGGEAEGGKTFLDILVDSAIGEGTGETFTAWEIVRAGGAGDWRLGGEAGDFWRDQAEGTAQVVLTRLRLYRGEWFLDVEKGTPWYEAVLGRGTREKIEPALRAEILGAPGVRSITTFNLAIEGRTASIAAELETIFGPVAVVGVL